MWPLWGSAKPRAGSCELKCLHQPRAALPEQPPFFPSKLPHPWSRPASRSLCPLPDEPGTPPNARSRSTVPTNQPASPQQLSHTHWRSGGTSYHPASHHNHLAIGGAE
ncbi:hypothetical protein GQ53DRAFT_388851 [Thozetella sp. PMI_491]|nr:hypothetical protein GQ53DRAFT_388851 [Thozetella sp. PMI_491]